LASSRRSPLAMRTARRPPAALDPFFGAAAMMRAFLPGYWNQAIERNYTRHCSGQPSPSAVRSLRRAPLSPVHDRAPRETFRCAAPFPSPSPSFCCRCCRTWCPRPTLPRSRLRRLPHPLPPPHLHLLQPPLQRLPRSRPLRRQPRLLRRLQRPLLPLLLRSPPLRPRPLQRPRHRPPRRLQPQPRSPLRLRRLRPPRRTSRHLPAG
jgi:hypothetical protein